MFFFLPYFQGGFSLPTLKSIPLKVMCSHKERRYIDYAEFLLQCLLLFLCFCGFVFFTVALLIGRFVLVSFSLLF